MVSGVIMESFRRARYNVFVEDWMPEPKRVKVFIVVTDRVCKGAL